MRRIFPYLGILCALAVGIVLYEYPVGPASRAVSVSPAASSTVVVVPSLFHQDSPAAYESAHASPASQAGSTSPASLSHGQVAPREGAPVTRQQSPAPAAPEKSANVSTPPVSPVAQAPAPAPAAEQASPDSASSALRAALVNILCYAPAGSQLHSISGSGVFIDSKGIILTNAHIAQYFLLSDRGVSCTIRTGSPATDAYKASLIFISPAWLHANSTVLTQNLPTGTGEYDFALLAVTSSATDAPLPAAFPAVSLANQPPAVDTPVVIASFGAQFLSSSQIRSGLSPTLVFGSVKSVFTFGTNTVDVFSLGGSAAAQEGSSGGGVADASGSLVGTLTTSTVTGATDTRVLSAITASYIRSEYASEMGEPLDSLLSQPTATSVNDFSSQISPLESIITASI